MADEPRMNFYRTFYDLTTLLPERERQKVNTALLDYFFNGTEPIGLSENGMKVFNGCAGRITKSRTNAANRAAGYAQTERATDCPTEQPTEGATKRATKPPTERATKVPTKELTKHAPEREREGDIEKEGDSAGVKRARFTAPTVEEVRGYAEEYAASKRLDPSDFSAERFVDHYASTGWRVGKSPMRDWRATVRNWVRSDCRELAGEVPGSVYDSL